MDNKLLQLKAMTDVVADTGDIEAIRRFTPVDATTNPSLLLKAAGLAHYASLLDDARHRARAVNACEATQLAVFCDEFAISIGKEILAIIPGRVSTEVDARLSFDTQATLARARGLIERYEDTGIARDRILIKIAATWEGIQAARELEREGINCNLTLLFGFSQAQACADAGVFLISPFVGRILDWHVAREALEVKHPEDDPGVQSVRRIYDYYKSHGYDTVVMGASFRNTGEIEALAGCDRLTISPGLLESLADDTGKLARVLNPDTSRSQDNKTPPRESDFRLAMNDDAMATEKLAEGIRNFVADQERLEALYTK